MFLGGLSPAKACNMQQEENATFQDTNRCKRLLIRNHRTLAPQEPVLHQGFVQFLKPLVNSKSTQITVQRILAIEEYSDFHHLLEH